MLEKLNPKRHKLLNFATAVAISFPIFSSKLQAAIPRDVDNHFASGLSSDGIEVNAKEKALEEKKGYFLQTIADLQPRIKYFSSEGIDKINALTIYLQNQDNQTNQDIYQEKARELVDEHSSMFTLIAEIKFLLKNIEKQGILQDFKNDPRESQVTLDLEDMVNFLKYIEPIESSLTEFLKEGGVPMYDLQNEITPEGTIKT